MKIVIISPYQLTLRRGVERFVHALANQLANDYGIEIIIYTWAAKKPVQWGQWHSKITMRLVPETNYFQEWLARFYYWCWIRYDKPDYTLLNFLFHGESSLPKKRCYISILHYPASQVPHRYKIISKITMKFINLNFVAVSQMVKKEALPYISQRRIEVIPNGVDINRFSAVDRQHHLLKTVRLTTLAALEERKGMQFVINALGLLRDTDITYDIYGDGPYRAELLLLVEKLQLSHIVHLHPSVDTPEHILKNADIFCLLSKGEAFPLAPLEAMAAGLPVIVSQYPPFDEIVTEEVGIMVERENPLKVAEAIKLLADHKKREELGRQGRKLVEERYSWEIIAKQYYAILNKG